jgi:hypothetical protein
MSEETRAKIAAANLGKVLSAETRERVSAARRRRSGTVEEQFWSRVQKTRGCWLWQGSVDRAGYGRIGPRTLAHRFSYELLVGLLIPGRHVIHHTCHQTLCVKPAHLVQLTRAEHNREHKERKAA